MDGWQIALLASAVLFASYLAFRMRPLVSERARTSAASLREAKKRIAGAKDDATRVAALCDAADACAGLGRYGAAVSFFLRALGVQPLAKKTMERAVAALAHRPGTLEKLVWRALGGAEWTAGEPREAALVGLRSLVTIYERKPRTQPRARAITHALALLDAGRPEP